MESAPIIWPILPLAPMCLSPFGFPLFGCHTARRHPSSALDLGPGLHLLSDSWMNELLSPNEMFHSDLLYALLVLAPLLTLFISLKSKPGTRSTPAKFSLLSVVTG